MNQDLTEAVNSGDLEEKTSLDDFTYRITKQFAQALLGKAYVFQKNYGAAATALDEVINSGKYDRTRLSCWTDKNPYPTPLHYLYL